MSVTQKKWFPIYLCNLLVPHRNYRLPIPTSLFQKSLLISSYGITVADLNFCLKLIRMTVTVTDPESGLLENLENLE